MTVNELVAVLQQYAAKGHGESQAMILDGFNGGGFPREINLGPSLQRITPEMAEESADCEDLIDSKVVILGYGSY